MPSFIVSSGQLLKALESVKGALASNSVVPICESFLLELRPGELRVTASNMEVRLSTDLEVEAVAEARLCVPGRLLLDTLKHMADQPTTFTIDTETHALALKSSTSQRHIAGEDARGYPLAPELEPTVEHQMRAGALQRALAKTVDFADQASQYPVWTGVSIRFAPTCLELAASDSLGALVRYQQKYDSETVPKEHQLVAPARALKLLAALLPKTETPARLGVSATHLGVAVRDGVVFTCRLIDHPYALYNNFIPKDLPQQFVTGREELQTSLRGLQGYTNATTLAACFDLVPGACILHANTLDHANEAREQLAGEFLGEGLKVGFRLPNLLIALSALDGEQVCLGLSTSHTAATLTPADPLANERIKIVLLPLAINL